MAETCLLSPPASAGRQALEAHLEMLRGMNEDDPLVALAIKEAERRLTDLQSV